MLNPDGVVYARLPGFPLSPDGRREAADLAEALGSAPVVAVYASRLERAKETADLLAIPHGVEVITDERLLEWSFWTNWEGMSWVRIRDRDPELLDVYGTDPEKAWPQDPLASAGARVLDWAADAEAAWAGRGSDGGLVLGVTHEAPLLAALVVGRGQDISGYRSLNLPHLSCVRLRPGPPEVVDLVAWAGSC